MTQPDPIKSQLRIPASLHQRLVEATAETGRSMNAEIVHRLEGSFAEAMDSDALLKSNLVIFQLAAELTRYNPNALDIVSGMITRLFDDAAVKARVHALADGGDEIASMARDMAFKRLPGILAEVVDKMNSIDDDEPAKP
ncbi:Arc family DNA-binding protein [Stenotrophomonas sp. S4]